MEFRPRAKAATVLCGALLAHCSLQWDPDDHRGGASAGTGGTWIDAATGGAAGSITAGSTGDAKSDVSCPPGFGDCNGDAGDGCETHLPTDANHCGACGHDCLGSTCKDSRCEPQLLMEFPVPGDDSRFGAQLTLSNDTLYVAYYANDGGVYRIPQAKGPLPAGGVPGEKLITLAETVDALPLGKNGFIASGLQGTVAADAPNGKRLDLGLGAWGIDSADGQLSVPTATRIEIYDIAQINASLAKLIPSAVSPISTIPAAGVLDATMVGGGVLCWTQNIDKLVDCTTWTNPQTTTTTPYATINDGQYVYWTEEAYGQPANYGVKRALINPGAAGTAVEQIVKTAIVGRGLCLHQNDLFVAAHKGTGYFIVRADKNGSFEEEIAEVGVPFGVAADDLFVYYSTRDAVFRLRR